MGLAERFEIGILVGEFFKVMIQFDGLADVALGGGQIAPLGRIATEVEMDKGILGVKAGGIGQDLGGRLDRVAAAFGEGPGDEPARLVRVGRGQACGETGSLLPAGGTFQKAKFEFLHTGIGGHGWGESLELFEGVGEHAQICIANGAFGMPEILP